MISQTFTAKLLVATLLICPFQCLKKSTKKAGTGVQEYVSFEMCSCCDDYNTENQTPPTKDKKTNQPQPDCICNGALTQVLSKSVEIDFTLINSLSFASGTLTQDPADFNLYLAGAVQNSTAHSPRILSGRDICALISLRLI